MARARSGACRLPMLTTRTVQLSRRKDSAAGVAQLKCLFKSQRDARNAESLVQIVQQEAGCKHELGLTVPALVKRIQQAQGHGPCTHCAAGDGGPLLHPSQACAPHSEAAGAHTAWNIPARGLPRLQKHADHAESQTPRPMHSHPQTLVPCARTASGPQGRLQKQTTNMWPVYKSLAA